MGSRLLFLLFSQVAIPVCSEVKTPKVEHVKWGHVCSAGGSPDHPVCEWRRDALKSLDTLSELANKTDGDTKNLNPHLGTCEAYVDHRNKLVENAYRKTLDDRGNVIDTIRSLREKVEQFDKMDEQCAPIITKYEDWIACNVTATPDECEKARTSWFEYMEKYIKSFRSQNTGVLRIEPLTGSAFLTSWTARKMYIRFHQHTFFYMNTYLDSLHAVIEKANAQMPSIEDKERDAKIEAECNSTFGDAFYDKFLHGRDFGDNFTGAFQEFQAIKENIKRVLDMSYTINEDANPLHNCRTGVVGARCYGPDDVLAREPKRVQEQADFIASVEAQRADARKASAFRRILNLQQNYITSNKTSLDVQKYLDGIGKR